MPGATRSTRKYRDLNLHMPGSKATERLFSRGAGQEPEPEDPLPGLLRSGPFPREPGVLYSPRQNVRSGAPEGEQIPIRQESWGYALEERLNKLDTEALERETATLYERVIGNSPTSRSRIHSSIPPAINSCLGAWTPGDSARLYLHALRDLAIGRPAPRSRALTSRASR